MIETVKLLIWMFRSLLITAHILQLL